MTPDDDPDFDIGAERALTAASRVALRPNWNLDGRSLIFETKEANTSRLHRLTLPDGTPTALDLCNEGATRVQGRVAFFGPDDFAFVSDRTGQPSIWRCDLVAGRTTQWTTPPEGASDFGPAVLPDPAGLILFFRIRGTDDRPRVYVGRPDPAGWTAPLTEPTCDQPWPLVGTRHMVYHSDRGGAHRIYRQAMHARTEAVAVGRHDEGTPYVTPYPSPDGRHVAFASVVDGRPHVFVARMDGRCRQAVTRGPVGAMFPCWRPDGEAIAYVRGDPMGSEPSGRLCMVSVRRRA